MNQLNDRRSVGDRVGIGRHAGGGNASRRRCQALAGNGGLVFVTRFAQPGTQVDEARANNLPLCVDVQISLESLRAVAQRRNAPLGDEYILISIALTGGVNDPAAPNVDALAHAVLSPDSWRMAMDMTAIRMAMPWVTC